MSKWERVSILAYIGILIIITIDLIIGISERGNKPIKPQITNIELSKQITDLSAKIDSINHAVQEIQVNTYVAE